MKNFEVFITFLLLAFYCRFMFIYESFLQMLWSLVLYKNPLNKLNKLIRYFLHFYIIFQIASLEAMPTPKLKSKHLQNKSQN